MTPEISNAIAEAIRYIGIGIGLAIGVWAGRGFPAFWKNDKK